MITHAFDNQSPAIIQPTVSESAPRADACILTFSWQIEQFALKNYPCERIGSFWFATGETPVYRIDYKGKKFGFYKTYVGAPACVGTVEDSRAVLRTDKYLVFGGAGCLNKEIAHGKVMIPTEAYRDEGTSYHYAPASDWIAVKKSDAVAAFMAQAGLPWIQGKTWTTDAVHRETRGNFEKRKSEGCISVEMECAAVQAMCDFRGLNAYFFFTCGDLLDAPKWDARMTKNQVKNTQHDPGHFDIALELARYIVR